MTLAPYFAVFTNRRIAAIALLGFVSGLPLALTGSSLQAWLSDAGLDVKTIGWFTLIGQPYTWKFLWAPLLDRFVPPFLGRRRGWIVLCQLLLACAIAALAGINPQTHLLTFGIIALLIAFFSATQDIAIDAYRVDVTTQEERGAASAVSVFAYRIAMLVSGAGVLVLADQYFNWQQTYLVMAAFMVGLALLTFFTPEPTTPAHTPANLEEAVILPFRDFFSRKGAILMLLAVILYKLGDAFAASLSTKFFLDMGFSKTEIAEVTKVFGLIATLIGGFIGASLMVKLGLFRSLIIFGILQALSNIGFWLLAQYGNDYTLLIAAIGFENLTSGMGTTANVAFLMALCNHRFSASQYALLSALSSFGRVYVGPAAGYIVASLGWADFFIFSIVAGVPGVVIIYYLRQQIRERDRV
jgi:PAT family beta-lactamase induction signal transducer AmpG